LEIADDVKDDVGVVTHRRTSTAGFPIDDVDDAAAVQEVLSLQISMEVNRPIGLNCE
jgi:hypothetical protein